ncbi:DNA-3-methyladenine glycosylase family protein [Helicovermis profundi]|uniref:DNA-(apurinic or apyrimidinic site) lyase n=1 Tax=Helicovermis profundi TaxID=3065157 RepID=A0AAU9EBN5_9FIRM|nr:DNA glycosylase [Clostridia bacterium S502]
MKYYYLDKEVIVENLKNFNLKHIFECGQAFRWKLEEDESYTFIIKNKIINVYEKGNKVIFRNITLDDFENLLIDYFDLKTDYGVIKKNLEKIDNNLKKAIEFGYGIRILNQDKIEMIISFIISANNRIPMIKRAIENLSEKFGIYIGKYKGRDYYQFPDLEVLANQDIENLRVSGVGFRDKYISKTSKMLVEKIITLEEIKNLPKDELKKELTKLSGVGPKVADCVMLFSFNKRNSFPIDTWVKKVMEHFYLGEDTTFKEIEKYSKDYFGELAGYAQQYLFYYARENKI